MYTNVCCLCDVRVHQSSHWFNPLEMRHDFNRNTPVTNAGSQDSIQFITSLKMQSNLQKIPIKLKLVHIHILHF